MRECLQTEPNDEVGWGLWKARGTLRPALTYGPTCMLLLPHHQGRLSLFLFPMLIPIPWSPNSETPSPTPKPCFPSDLTQRVPSGAAQKPRRWECPRWSPLCDEAVGQVTGLSGLGLSFLIHVMGSTPTPDTPASQVAASG